MLLLTRCYWDDKIKKGGMDKGERKKKKMLMEVTKHEGKRHLGGPSHR